MAEHKVTVYSTPTCPHCHEVKDFLKQQNVAFEEVNLMANREKAKELIQKTGQMSVPMTEVDEEIVIGANITKLSELLEL